MPAVVSMLRAVNLGAHNRVRMEDLRTLYTSLKLDRPQTYVQSGNVVFHTREKDLAKVARRIEEAIHRTFGFRTNAILRTAPQIRATVANNPFAGRTDIEPSKLLVNFLASTPSAEAAGVVRQLSVAPEELRIHDSELYIYFPNGAGKTKLSWMKIEKLLGIPGTTRNWNSVNRLLEMAEALDA